MDMQSGNASPIATRILDGVLGFAPVVERPTFAEGIADRLKDALIERIADVVADDASLWIGKYQLARVHQCEGLFQASIDEPFVWTVPMLRGRVAHKALEATIMLGADAPPPLDLVERAIQRLAEGEEQDAVAVFLKELEPMDAATLRSGANDAVVRFKADWPEIKRAWMPRVESRVRVRLMNNRVILAATYDLALGRPKGMEARVIIVDFKTGHPSPVHAEDLRFYALVETLRSGVPPFRVASYYLEEGTFQVEDVTEDLLDVAIRRTADGIRAIAGVASGAKELALNPGSYCRWCPATTCEPGQQHLAAIHNKDEVRT